MATARKFTPAIDCTAETRPAIALTPIGSKKVYAVGYCPQRQILAASFSPTGAIYHYEGFTQEDYDALMGAESKGKHFGDHIQSRASKKYSPDPAPAQQEDQAEA